MTEESSTQSDTTMSARRTPETDNSSISSSADHSLRLQDPLPEPLCKRLRELYSVNITAKVLRASVDCLQNNVSPLSHVSMFDATPILTPMQYPIAAYPEYVPQRGTNAGLYIMREASFWTCGFFPGCIYGLVERLVKYPQSITSGPHKALILGQLREQGAIWSEPIHSMASRTDTHDMSFMVQPSMRPRWELFGDERALASIIAAARSLHTRYNPVAGAIRSWDALEQEGVQITSLTHDFLVIIDSMVNLDLLFYAAHHTGQVELAHAATAHARTLLRTNLRRETQVSRAGYAGPLFSTFHVANLDPLTGDVKERRTAQGYARDSTWARGQAWGILGYAQTFGWTGESEFLEAACGLAEYFLLRLEKAPACVEREMGDGKVCGRYVPLWDFDAPVDETDPLRDSSAGVIAANGLLVLSQHLAATGQNELAVRYRDAAVMLVEDALAFSLAEERAVLKVSNGEIKTEDATEGKRFDAVLKNATANHNARDHRRYWDHGLVYGDYYLIEFGNMLLRMGLA